MMIDCTPPVKTIEFIYNQEDSKNVISERVASVAQIEKLVHHEFKQDLSKDEASTLYKDSKLDAWNGYDCSPKGKRKR